jgi:hypothetical protein
MRSLLLALAAMFACASAWADGHIIKWDRFEGVHFQAADYPCIGGVICPGRPRTSGPGQAILNLETGLLTFRVTGISNAAPYSNGVLGGPAASGGTFLGTVVCNSTQRYGLMEFVDTPPIWFMNGGGSFTGFVALPVGCKEQPEETVFLVRRTSDGTYIAFGAGRTIR